MSEQELALRGLRAADFDWTMHIKGVWRDAVHDVSHLHQEERDQITSELERLNHSDSTASPLSMVMVGSPGAGKTHLLAAMRKHAAAHGFGFVLADMTDVRDFWESLLHGYITSLQQVESDGASQFQKLIISLIAFTGSSVLPGQLAKAPVETLVKATKVILTALLRKDRQATTQFQDVIRAVLLLNSNDIDAFNTGDCWLQGLEIEKVDKTKFGFSRAAMDSAGIVGGLSWLMSLRSPSLLALDQLDSIVTQHHLAAGSGMNPQLSDEQRLSKSIIEGIGGGLMALRDKTHRTLTVVSCLAVTWSILKKEVVQSFKDRFRDEMFLGTVREQAIAEQIVASRLQPSYKQVGYTPKYPTYPFAPEFLKAAREQLPRTILQRCNKHREQCLANGSIQEIHSFALGSEASTPDLTVEHLDRVFATLKQQVKPTDLLGEQCEDEKLGALLQTVCFCLIKENPTLDVIDANVEVERLTGSYPSLHARVRLVFRNEGDREKHLCLRALQRTNAKAYQTRLKAAMTASGIDRSLSFRRLLVVRTTAIPGGAATQQLTRKFQDAGGLFKQPSEDEIRVLAALHELKQKQDPQFEQWLRGRRPASQLSLLQEVTAWLFEDALAQAGGSPEAVKTTGSQPSRIPSDVNGASSRESVGKVSSDRPFIATARSSSGDLSVGARLIGQQAKEQVVIQLEALAKHAVVLAGSGSGKTVLVRRLVEEAAMQGVPAIIIDGANDLARMGDHWPSAPASWQSEDMQKAEQYHQSTQVLVWTPGREAGNPLSLKPLPDFAAVANDRDEFQQAIDMARDSLQEIVAAGKSATAKIKQGVLRNALEYFAEEGGGSLEAFASLLTDLPSEAGRGIGNAEKKAREIADLLNAEMANNPLLRQSGSALDPAVLFGLNKESGKTRLSVVNFIGLPSLNAQQQFLNQLAMTLFTWIKKHPAPANQPLRGLLVIDEAKDFVPSSGSTPCKASLIRLAAQARKYGLGLIFATQAPKSIDHNIIANCTTQFYGRANSPAAIEVIQSQLSQRGGSGQDIANLERGQFYLASEALTKPIKILAPLCLSYHPPAPLDEGEVLKRAVESRKGI